jgi:hypothetical protein
MKEEIIIDDRFTDRYRQITLAEAVGSGESLPAASSERRMLTR